MTHIIEEAKSGRSKCRGCGQAISKGEARFGERFPNPFADDSDMTLWFHLMCGALRRPESFSEVLTEAHADYSTLAPLVEAGLAHHRLDRIGGVEKASSGRARCRHCKETIAQGEWRIPLVFFEEGMLNRSGFIHLSCSGEYFETKDIVTRLQHFADELSPADLTEITAGLQ